jgi:hypothetical protein
LEGFKHHVKVNTISNSTEDVVSVQDCGEVEAGNQVNDHVKAPEELQAIGK